MNKKKIEKTLFKISLLIGNFSTKQIYDLKSVAENGKMDKD